MIDKDYVSKYNKYYKDKHKKPVYDNLGNKCNHCGFSDTRALQIDHINGGGSKEMKIMSNRANYYKEILRSLLNNENKYQLLCANCNWIKRFNKKETV